MIGFKFKQFTKPSYKILVKEGEKYLWPLFHEHHYMTCNLDCNTSLPRSSKFFTFYWEREGKEVLVGCLGVLNQISKYPARRITRMVILPDFQGLGFASIMLNSISELYARENITMYISTFHPRLGSFFEHSKDWEASNNNMTTFRTSKVEEGPLKDTIRDGVAMFRYHYTGGSKFTLEYNPLTLSKLESLLKSTDSNDKEYKKIKRKILQEQRKVGEIFTDETLEALKVSSPKHIKSKEEHKKIFNKNKRKTLSPEERKAKKEELKKKKSNTTNTTNASNTSNNVLDDF